MRRKRIVVTGMGTVNPLGHNVDDTWEKASEGIGGIDRISHFDPSELNSQVAGEVHNFDISELYNIYSHKQAKRLDKFVHFATAASREAIRQSALDIGSDPYGTAVVIGSGIGGLPTQQENGASLSKRGMRGVSPMYIPATIGNIAAGTVGIEFGLQGPNLATQTACATSNHAFAIGHMLINMGHCHSVLAGGTETAVVEIGVAGFARMHALSTHYNDQPQRASRPYDKNRDGFVISEGAGILVLEELEHARARGADILAELLSVGMSGDAYDIVIPHPEGIGALRSMRTAIEQGEVNPSEIDYINTHGTSTPLGDLSEAKAVHRLLNGSNDRIHIGSTKGMHGHLLGATAGLEAILCIKAIETSLVPPNINIDDFDKNIPLKKEMINQVPIEKEINIVLSNSFGFGGHNSTIVLKKFTN